MSELAPKTDAGWLDAIQAELAKIKGRGSAKKKKTIIALVEARLTGVPIDGLWGKDGLPHRQTYYSVDLDQNGRKRGWKYDETFAVVLEASTLIATEWQTQVELQEFEARMKRWGGQVDSIYDRSLETVEAMLDKANKMLQFPLQEVTVEHDEETGEPTTVINPARWSMDTVARFAKTAVELANAAQALMDLKQNGPQQSPFVQINNTTVNQQNVQNNTAVMLTKELAEAEDDELDAMIHNLLYLTDGKQ